MGKSIPPDLDDGSIRAALAKAGARPEAISHRSHFYDSGVVFFNGESVPIRRVSGVDWSAEAPSSPHSRGLKATHRVCVTGTAS